MSKLIIHERLCHLRLDELAGNGNVAGTQRLNVT